MLSPQQAAKDSAPDAEAIRMQLNRLLAHPLFTNSKRYPVLLAYTVEQTLLGNAADLKERTIGIEAFGRDPDYDVNLDPVVRTSAAEVRRRLIQYYYDPSHASEPIIELTAGSYIPVFREPDSTPANGTGVIPELNSGAPTQTPLPHSRAIQPSAAHAPFSLRRLVAAAAALLLALAAGIAIGRFHPTHPPSEVERFWEPIAASQSPVTYCLGEPADTMKDSKKFLDGAVLGGLDVSDVLTLARTIAPLVPRHGAFRVLSASDASFAQLREGPIVLIGAFDNAWTMRITQNLRFGFEDRDGTRMVVDRKNPHRFWPLQWDVPDRTLATDYAIVARIHDNTTGQPVIIVAGILGEGTQAASEVLYNPTYLNAMLQKAPKNWDRLNLEAVIETHVIDGNPGPPEILDVESW